MVYSKEPNLTDVQSSATLGENICRRDSRRSLLQPTYASAIHEDVEHVNDGTNAKNVYGASQEYSEAEITTETREPTVTTQYHKLNERYGILKHEKMLQTR